MKFNRFKYPIRFGIEIAL